MRRHQLRETLRHPGLQWLQRVLQEVREEKTHLQVRILSTFIIFMRNFTKHILAPNNTSLVITLNPWIIRRLILFWPLLYINIFKFCMSIINSPLLANCQKPLIDRQSFNSFWVISGCVNICPFHSLLSLLSMLWYSIHEDRDIFSIKLL